MAKPIKKPKPKRGRPRKLLDGSVVFAVRLSPVSCDALQELAEKKGVEAADLARLAIDEWLLACAVGQRPVARSAS